MFYARQDELKRLQRQLAQPTKTAVLVYGKRCIGKSTLIKEAAKTFDGTVINYLCVQSSYEGNLSLLSRSICQSLHFPQMQFTQLHDIFTFLGTQNQNILLILDEYQYLKNTGRKNEIDSYMQGIIDQLPSNIKLILCGSYITMMRELLEEENPLFGRFTEIIHLNELDYVDAALFDAQAETGRKIENYAVFGGSPYVLENVDPGVSVEENIERLLLPATGILRSYIENVMLREIQKAYDVRIFEVIGNGKKKYSEIESVLGKTNGLLDKQLKNLLDMDAISKVYPINKPNDKRKQFYTIQDNLMRFYFTYIFGNSGIIERLGEKAYAKLYIEPSLQEFISRRFEDMAGQYFQRQVKQGKRQGVYDIGTYWYDDPVSRTNGEFDCVLKMADGYDFYECKYYDHPMTREECQKEVMQLSALKGINCRKVGFVCLGGFTFQDEQIELIDGEMLFV